MLELALALALAGRSVRVADDAATEAATDAARNRPRPWTVVDGECSAPQRVTALSLPSGYVSRSIRQERALGLWHADYYVTASQRVLIEFNEVKEQPPAKS